MIVPVTVCIILLAAVVYLAVSRRSSFTVRIAALVALAAMVLTVIICLFRIFMTPPATANVQVLPDQPPPPPPPPPNTMALVLFIVILITVFLVVLFLSVKEQHRVTKEDEGLSKLGL
jgi:amino acid transporter